jgi:histidinol phosphatase-like enzyme (inositol monophosphatase family)
MGRNTHEKDVKMTESTSLREYLDFAIDAAWQAGQFTLAHFQTGVAVNWKEDQSPVTAADQGAEKLLRELIGRRFPEHAILGEEMGEEENSKKNGSHRWIIDPIDGTQSFIAGVPLYGVLLGLEIEGDMVVGVAYFPGLSEMVSAARGLGCRWNGRLSRVSDVDRLEDSRLAFTDISDLERVERDAWSLLKQATRIQRGWGDCYGHCLVATGRAEVMLDPLMKVWDCAALLPILQEAGGTFTDWKGKPTVYASNAVSTNGALFESVINILGF